MYEPTTPSAATRPSFFFAEAKPRSRKISFARSSLPPASISAFLHSIIPAPVFSRSALTAAALMSAMITYLLLITTLIYENAQPGGGSAAEAALAIYNYRKFNLRRRPPRSLRRFRSRRQFQLRWLQHRSVRRRFQLQSHPRRLSQAAARFPHSFR